jgi:predicted RNA-binding Zn-ribbon protein involved in translation (DUF1610 family)
MEAPEEFVSRLDSAFDGRLRIRWSAAEGAYHIEQRVARALVNFPAGTSDDEAIRLRDGYHLIMVVRSGDRMPCPRCGATLKVPLRSSTVVTCDTCRQRGLEYRIAAAHYPLDDTLIDHLKSAKLTEQQQQAVLDQLTSKANDDFNRIAGIPSVGYTGKVLSLP